MMSKGWLFVLLSVFFVSLSLSQSIPPSGLDIILSSAALGSTAQLYTDSIVNDINSYTGWQSISGSGSSASYTFSNWKVAIAAEYPQWKDVGATEFLLGWREFNFTIESTYHVCDNSWPNPCEDGNMYVYTTDPYTKLYLDTILDMDQTPIFINVTTTDLDFRNKGIMIYVQCTDTFCLIPVDDIAQAVAENFVTLFQNAVAAAARKELEKFTGEFKTEFTAADGLGLDVEMNWFLIPGDTGGENGVIFVPDAGGFFTNISETITNPPFGPAFAPPTSYLFNTSQDLTIVVTEYLFSSLTWAMGNAGLYDKTITSSEVPSASPVQLNTDDAFFLQVVPGLSVYPHMDITITTSLITVSVPTIDGDGLHVWGTNMTFDFALSNSSYSTHGWTLSNIFDIDFEVAAEASGNMIIFNATMTNFSSTVTVLQSSCGTISGSGFSTLYQLLSSQLKFPGFVMTLPATVSVSNPSVEYYDQYMAFGLDFGITYGNEDFFALDNMKTISIV